MKMKAFTYDFSVSSWQYIVGLCKWNAWMNILRYQLNLYESFKQVFQMFLVRSAFD